MKKTIEIIYLIIGFIILGVFFYFLYSIVKFMLDNLSKININVLTAIIGGTITISGFFITRYIEKKKNIELQIINKKIPIYEEFMEFYFNVVFSNLPQEEIRNFFRDFNQKAIIWFPDEILKSYIQWKENLIKFSEKEKGDNTIKLSDIILQQENFMKQIRKDIGHNNQDINQWEISSLYINDLKNITQ
ncbi:hypothetical protein [Elizabethkingia anophelis]|uniref:hypothetical protein n=1 Tax=Elizabethkingia anophelis TaxID=1117645 RepID=UPI001D66E5E4|nr:hypothetical protein [Elizabethkingia anophelis]EHM7983049.1 hypothetical protein [Elizabethkingia anophelis]EHM8030271.1 hypothetical protein [Elizabethkingia anophelis]EHZ9533025.1 hypothetical protein [Elizabethkingia anophelis]EKU3670935.1 hypothetical protein [Elizabethkingia anophelis]EKW9476304.1 hypothetical protein [Elizabethkingia anophelis]